MANQPQVKTSANATRAGWAQRALAAYILTTGVEKESAVADLISNIQHLCQQDPSFGDFEEEVARSGRNFARDSDDDLVREFNCEQIGTVIVVNMNGGLINEVRASEPIRVIFLDEDTEGGDEERIYTVSGEEVYVTEYLVLPGDVDPNSVANVAKEIDDADCL